MLIRKLCIFILLAALSSLTKAQDTALNKVRDGISNSRMSNHLSETSSQTGNFVVEKLSTRVSFYGGTGYLFKPLNKIISYDYQPYINKLKLGYIYGAEITVFPKDLIGIGLKYLIFQDNYAFNPFRDADNFTTTYAGLVLSIKRPTGWKPLYVICGVSLGYLSNSNSGSQGGAPWNAKGSSLGATTDAGLDLHISQHMAIGIDLLLIGGNIKSYSINGVTANLANADNLLRMDLTGGLRFYF